MRYAGGLRHPEKGNWLYQNQNRPVYHKFWWKLYHKKYIDSNPKKGASVSEEFALFNWSSVDIYEFILCKDSHLEENHVHGLRITLYMYFALYKYIYDYNSTIYIIWT